MFSWGKTGSRNSGEMCSVIIEFLFNCSSSQIFGNIIFYLYYSDPSISRIQKLPFVTTIRSYFSKIVFLSYKYIKICIVDTFAPTSPYNMQPCINKIFCKNSCLIPYSKIWIFSCETSFFLKFSI